jgi:hypothetical protein
MPRELLVKEERVATPARFAVERGTKTLHPPTHNLISATTPSQMNVIATIAPAAHNDPHAARPDERSPVRTRAHNLLSELVTLSPGTLGTLDPS